MKTLEKSKILVIILGISCFCNSCSLTKIPYEEAYSKLKQCKKNWYFVEISENLDITVVLFEKKYLQTAKINPAFIVGLTESGDTIGAIDKRFSLDLKKGDKVKLTQSVWSIDTVETMHNYPVFNVYQKEEEIAAICRVQKIYNTTFNKVE